MSQLFNYILQFAIDVLVADITMNHTQTLALVPNFTYHGELNKAIAVSYALRYTYPMHFNVLENKYLLLSGVIFLTITATAVGIAPATTLYPLWKFISWSLFVDVAGLQLSATAADKVGIRYFLALVFYNM
jgi:hypothetical protein